LHSLCTGVWPATCVDDEASDDEASDDEASDDEASDDSSPRHDLT
jgi:hypothetical protein